MSAFEIELLKDRWGTLSFSPDEYLPHFDARLAGLNYIAEEDPTFVSLVGSTINVTGISGAPRRSRA